MAKGQQKSNREVKKPKKSASDKLKSAKPAAGVKSSISGDKTPSKKG
jgi:hypothetical protein